MHVEGREDGKTPLAEIMVDGWGHARGEELLGENLATHGAYVLRSQGQGEGEGEGEGEVDMTVVW